MEGTSLQPSQDSTGMPLSSGPGCLLSLLSQILFPWISLGLVPHPIQSLLTYHFTEEAVPGLPKRGLPSPTLSSFPHCNSLTGKQAPSLGERGGVCGLPLPPERSSTAWDSSLFGSPLLLSAQVSSCLPRRREALALLLNRRSNESKDPFV